jgi:hypothetical protein
LVNEAVDLKYEECDVPIPFPVVVVADKACFIMCNYIDLFWIEWDAEVGNRA